jgi:hypothetical protein
MKKAFSAILLLVAIKAWSQTTALTNVYAYSQPVIPGTMPSVLIGENGKQEEVKPAERVNYLLYAVQRRSTSISFITVWINGKAYPIKADSVSVIPLQMDVPGKETYKETVTLVPETKHKVWVISPGSMIAAPARPSATLQKLIKKSELVVVYKWKGKLYYHAVRKINKLPPALSV